MVELFLFGELVGIQPGDAFTALVGDGLTVGLGDLALHLIVFERQTALVVGDGDLVLATGRFVGGGQETVQATVGVEVENKLLTTSSAT